MSLAVIDTETTGLDTERDEILEIAILDENGDVLLNSLVRPTRHTEWPAAQRIHNISPEDVANAPTLTDLAQQIHDSVDGRTVVIYNADFDSELLKGYLGGAKEIRCCMEAYSYHQETITGEPWRRHKLVQAAYDADHDWGQDAAHRAIHDASATLTVWNWLDRQ
ncbi:3'-5' exonuclease [Marinobacter salsuginis]|jgi:DNA polymerase-3 subunit epsilon|uniref:DNA polymerase III subunit epsilon n=1 Tax=Marinobacter salsuginis TaxID=418719 RepID=A0A5M3Q275_9GAMM|nr:3'-5' exonuclease [Marinobacter salsuginis]GBO89227.1 DNA polymerase III subunit epsilon [Marinobacter salsuginis]